MTPSSVHDYRSTASCDLHGFHIWMQNDSKFRSDKSSNKSHITHITSVPKGRCIRLTIESSCIHQLIGPKPMLARYRGANLIYVVVTYSLCSTGFTLHALLCYVVKLCLTNLVSLLPLRRWPCWLCCVAKTILLC